MLNPSIVTIGSTETAIFKDERIFKPVYGTFLGFNKSQFNRKILWSV